MTTMYNLKQFQLMNKAGCKWYNYKSLSCMVNNKKYKITSG